MANPIRLTGAQKILVGKQIIEASTDVVKLTELLNDPKAFFGGDIPTNDHQIVPHVNTANVTHIMIPYNGFIMTGGDYRHPGEYDSAHASYIDPINDQDAAYRFRVGDYVFAQCG